MPNIKPIEGDWITLYSALPKKIQFGIQAGKYEASLTSLRKWGQFAFRHRKAICRLITSGKCRTLTEAIQKYEYVSHEETLAQRLRQARKNGELPMYLLNHTPPTWSGDLESFFIPPDQPERELPESDPVEIAPPIPRKIKRWMTTQSEPE